MSSDIAVLGVYGRKDQANSVADQLRLAGFRSEDITVVDDPDEFITALKDASIPESEVGRYVTRIREGRSVVCVRCDNAYWSNAAKEVLDRTGAENITSAQPSRFDASK
jgi:hypothetical protein